MKILHTSDWHLGRSLYGRKRYDEFSAFLNWLVDLIQREHVDALLIAGDVFDSATPSNLAQKLYYRFLINVSATCCDHVVIISGNHDSPSFLNAPKELLEALNVYVVGSITENPEDEVIVLDDLSEKGPSKTGNTNSAIICAVPYLRDKDIRLVEPGETIDDKNSKLVKGLIRHYSDVCDIAEQKQRAFLKNGYSGVPIIAMGHLFTAGGKTVDGDGVRELYVGSLAHVSKEVFPSSIDYLALGHLHVSQRVGGAEHIRYCGSPIPIGYGEAGQTKNVIVIEFNSTTPVIQEFMVPCFQALVRIVGSLDDIHSRIDQLKREKSTAWLEIEYTGADFIGNLRQILEEALSDSSMEIRRIKNKRVTDQVMSAIQENETLDDLGVNDVFERCLETFDVPHEDRIELTDAYNEIIKSLHEEDTNLE